MQIKKAVLLCTLRRLGVLVWLLLLAPQPLSAELVPSHSDLKVSLSGNWSFKLDPENLGLSENWHLGSLDRSSWRKVNIPHTWQVEKGTEEYYGVAWYAQSLEADPLWEGSSIWVHFESIYRDALVWINGHLVAEHMGSGWTPFEIKLDDVWTGGEENWLVIRVDNQFREHALPYLDSSDWAADGGIIRGVYLRILPAMNIRRIRVQGVPVQKNREAEITALIGLSESVGFGTEFEVEGDVFGPEGRIQARMKADRELPEVTGSQLSFSARIENPDLWHFDHPQLYKFRCRLYHKGELIHQREADFGIRSIEVRDGLYWLNGEPMRLMGLEWMPGSDPRFGMAEPASVSHEVLRDLKRLNTVSSLTQFTISVTGREFWFKKRCQPGDPRR
ncbi:MAG: sugar-binding domain-containing protein [bacterium]